MNPEIRQLWTNALLSGFYVKGRPGLMKDDEQCGYCVLGVLTDLFCQANNVAWEKIPGANGVLAPNVADWAGLSSFRHKAEPTPYTETYDPVTSKGPLSKLNDKGYSFQQLAEIIDEEL